MKKVSLAFFGYISIFMLGSAFATTVYPTQCPTIAELGNLADKPNPQVEYYAPEQVAVVVFGGFTPLRAPILGVAIHEPNKEQAISDAMASVKNLSPATIPALKQEESGQFCSFAGDLNVQHPEKTTQLPSILAAVKQ